MAKKTKCGMSSKKVDCSMFKNACLGCKMRPKNQIFKKVMGASSLAA